MDESAPTDYEALRAAITERHGSLSKRLRQIANYALDHPTDMAIETIAVIAKRAEVQPSALIRFAKSFDYTGFSQMQRAFQTRIAERSASYKERVRAAQDAEIKDELGSRALTAESVMRYQHHLADGTERKPYSRKARRRRGSS